MKSPLRFFSQTIAFLLTLTLFTSVSMSPQSCASPISQQQSMQDGNIPISPSSDTEDQSSNTSDPSNSTEESDNDVAAIGDQNTVEPFYSVIIPLELHPMLGHSIPPLHRPPRT